MKSFLFLLVFLLVSCAPKYSTVQYSYSTPYKVKDDTLNVGQLFFTEEYMSGGVENSTGIVRDGVAVKYTLTLTSASDNKLTLAYEEFNKPFYDYMGTYYQNAMWIPRGEANKTFTYEFGDGSRIVKFANYTFNITSIKDGTIVYRLTDSIKTNTLR